MTRYERAASERGFTLIELLVVMGIVAILAAIAIPVFFEQKEKAYVAQVQHSLKDAALSAETYAAGNNGSYVGLNGLDGTDPLLVGLGFNQPAWAQAPSVVGYLRFRNVTATYYCIESRHEMLTTSSDWRRSTYESTMGVPRPVPDNC